MPVAVADILEYLASGMSEQAVLDQFPDLEAEDIRASLAFAAERERRLLAIPGRASCSTTTWPLGWWSAWLTGPRTTRYCQISSFSAAPSCAATCSSIQVWNSSCSWMVTKPRIR